MLPEDLEKSDISRTSCGSRVMSLSGWLNYAFVGGFIVIEAVKITW